MLSAIEKNPQNLVKTFIKDYQAKDSSNNSYLCYNLILESRQNIDELKLDTIKDSVLTILNKQKKSTLIYLEVEENLCGILFTLTTAISVGEIVRRIKATSTYRITGGKKGSFWLKDKICTVNCRDT